VSSTAARASGFCFIADSFYQERLTLRTTPHGLSCMRAAFSTLLQPRHRSAWHGLLFSVCYNLLMDSPDPLGLFLPPVRQWFRSSLGEPTAAERQGWPAIAAGQHTLILAPTGSGKTLAAFLACLDGLWRQDPLPRGVCVLYVSPLKALNNDIY